MRRRDVIALVGSAAVGWPAVLHAQQGERPRRIGILMLYPDSDPQGQLRAEAFRQGLEKHGWVVGHNVEIDVGWGVGDRDWVRSTAAHLLRSRPDIIVANGDPSAQAFRQLERNVPVIFIGGADPVADGLVQSLARPGGNMTGFAVMEPSLGPKLLELLKQVAPHISQVAVLFNPANNGNQHIAASTREAAPRFGAEVVLSPVRGASDIEAAVAQGGREPNSGLIVLSDPGTNSHRKLIIDLCARHQLPAIHTLRSAATEGALMSYGVDIPELFRQAAVYADRILKGAKTADLPVQLPTKFELIVNLKTAKALGLTIPTALHATADDVIE